MYESHNWSRALYAQLDWTESEVKIRRARRVVVPSLRERAQLIKVAPRQAAGCRPRVRIILARDDLPTAGTRTTWSEDVDRSRYCQDQSELGNGKDNYTLIEEWQYL
ncbi:uncharacterized protein F5147DRAFT_648555 [Suillus discolor]|uniref:Uncharacterized protein n=1 Tax=Suillus discolor TaxID=1912936 RepID=A0A9P7FH63_9AGAM|nr:uncharacterized protein F5147DRAFT_648555 [Suillus discolor]KAG2118183.1 hypothetical protein F5147DRAFT_648555 [Suillus discolor]